MFRIPLPLPQDGLRAVNVYAIAEGDGVVLIDAGWVGADTEAHLRQGLDRIGYGFEDIKEFLITHSHADHYTQAVALRRRHGMAIALGVGERVSLEWIRPDRVTRPFGQYPQLERAGATDVITELNALPEEHSVTIDTWELPDVWLSGSPLICLQKRSLRAIPTPGHTRGHYVFHDEASGVLFAGDHVLPQITPSLGFEAVPQHSPLTTYLASLLLVRTMPDALLLPAHGPVAQSVHARIDELLNHHGDRLEATMSAIRHGACTAREAAEQLGWTRRARRLSELSTFDRMLAVLETAAHLDLLAERQLVTVSIEHGTARYTAV